MANHDLERTGDAKGRKGNSLSSIYGIEDDYDTKWSPWLIPMFVVINVVMFIVVMRINNCPHKNSGCVARFLGRLSFQPLRENPLLGPTSSTLLNLGGLQNTKLVHEHQVWRLFTCIWLHAGVIHLLSNMLCLFFIGVRLEQQFGFVRIGIIYLLSGIGGSVLSSLFIQSSISVGASGALFGLLGAMLSELITNWAMYSNKVAAFLTLLFIIVVNLVIGILPHVNNFAHIGGFITGFLLGFVLLPRPQFAWRHQHNLSPNTNSRYKVYQYVLWFIALALLITGFTIGLVSVFRGVNGNEHCHWCHYLSCVPTSRWSCDNDET